MSSTGVGGIKDSQGNFEIVGASNSTLGTRGGTLLVPVGDVIGQTSGTLAANVYTATTLGNTSTVSLNVQAFVPGSPPTPANVVSSLTMGVDVGGGGVLALIAKSSDLAADYGVKVGVDATMGAYTTLSGATTWLEGNSAYPNKLPTASTGSSAVDAFFAFHFSGAGSRNLTLPFNGQICDVIAQINSAGSVVALIDAVDVTTLFAGAVVRRATSFSPAVPSFTKGQTLTVTLDATVVGTALVRVYYLRTGAVL
jgi:hypothetical protein